jgi:hypothetical protein
LTAVIVLISAHLSAFTIVGRLGRSIASASGGSNGLGDGAVLDGEGGGLGDSVGFVAISESGNIGIVVGQVSDDLSGVVDGLVRRRLVVRRCQGHA